MIKLHEMEGDFDSLPRAVFVSERARRKYWGEDEPTPDEKEKKENA